PVWWKTWWAVLIYISLTAAFLIVFFYFRISQLKYHKTLELEKEKAKLQHENDEVKLKFFTNISHEFRTPLTLITGPLETILNTINPNQKVNAIMQQLKLIHKNASRLNVLINRVLEFRKIQTGNIKINWSKEDIVHIIKDVYENFKGLAEQKKINYSFHSFYSNFEAWIDINKLQHVLFNLISNAFKFTHDAGSIEISFDTDDYTVENIELNKCLKIKVRDSGIGIPEKELSSIFSRFHRVDNEGTGDAKIPGTGIGLELSKEYVELMGGEISVSSEQGKGTEFHIIIPYYTDEIIKELTTNKHNHIVLEEEYSEIITDELSYDPGLIAETKQESESEDSGNSSVFLEKKNLPAMLIVEDNLELLNFLKENYSKIYNVIEAVNGQQGIDAALNDVPDIIISDIMMPEIDGIELCRQLKANKITSHIPVILLTAKSLVEHQIKGYETGADDYITKPFDINILNTRIINLLENRKRIQRFFLSDMFNDLQHIPQISSANKIFLTEIEEIVENSYMSEDFTVEQFAERMKISRSQLHRKFMGFLGISPSSYLKRYRLNKAAEMLKSTSSPNIAEISFKCGFKHPSHFTRSFRQLFNISPTEYIKQ
ncbi:MAG: ATP-binding protein, partial [Bacteroidota bacterium]